MKPTLDYARKVLEADLTGWITYRQYTGLRTDKLSLLLERCRVYWLPECSGVIWLARRRKL